MRALPIDVVKALIAIVDCRGFTRAAEQLGRTQPTISLQIRRLEELVGAPMFDNTARLTLSPRGRLVVEYGRKLVAAHQDLVEALQHQGASGALRLGAPHELAAWLAPSLVDLAHRSGEAFEVSCEASETLIERVRAQQLDLALAITAADEAQGGAAHWTLPLCWIAGPRAALSEGGPVRLVTPPEGTLFYDIAVAALARAGRKFEIVCKSASPDVLRSAVEAGYGVAVAPIALAPKGVRLAPPSSLPPMPDVALGLYAREGVGERGRAPLIAHIVETLRAAPVLAAA